MPSQVPGFRSVIIEAMSLADLLPGRLGPAGRMPDRIDELRGPVSGVIMLPRYLAWPGMREFDVGDGVSRRTLYGMLLAQGKRNDIARLVNATMLGQDWPLIARSLDPRLGRWCERRFGLGGHAGTGQPGGDDLTDGVGCESAEPV